jgi:hypothetical protein
MTRSSTRVLQHGLLALCAGLFAMATVLSTAAPAVPKHHTRKPHKLWSQYPLNVQGPTPSATPSGATSQQVVPTPSASKSQAAPSDKTTGRSANAGMTSGKLIFVGGTAILLAALVLIVRRVKLPTPDGNGEDRPHTPPGPATAVASNGDGHGYNRAVIETTSEPWMRPVPTRVRLQLEDGRSLEGFTRESASTDSELVILEVVTTFDPNGKEAPPRPSDSFILRSEIASMQRIEES